MTSLLSLCPLELSWNIPFPPKVALHQVFGHSNQKSNWNTFGAPSPFSLSTLTTIRKNFFQSLCHLAVVVRSTRNDSKSIQDCLHLYRGDVAHTCWPAAVPEGMLNSKSVHFWGWCTLCTWGSGASGGGVGVGPVAVPSPGNYLFAVNNGASALRLILWWRWNYLIRFGCSSHHLLTSHPSRRVH